mgnify:CR=1 FL=1
MVTPMTVVILILSLFGIMLWPEGLVVFLLFFSGYQLVAIIAVACIGLKRAIFPRRD